MHAALVGFEAPLPDSFLFQVFLWVSLTVLVESVCIAGSSHKADYQVPHARSEVSHAKRSIAMSVVAGGLVGASCAVVCSMVSVTWSDVVWFMLCS